MGGGWGGGGPLTSLEAALAADVPVIGDVLYHDIGVSVALTPGRWLINAVMGVDADPAGTVVQIFGRLVAGATVIGGSTARADGAGSDGGGQATLTFADVHVAAGAETLKFQARTTDAVNGSVVKSAWDGGPAGTATRITAVKIG